MALIPINWVTSDFERWGVGLQRLLEASEIDRNFWELKSALEFVIEHPPSPVEIVSFTLTGLGMSITMSSGSVIGPLPLPILAWRWRDTWLPFVPYAALDVFKIEGTGIFLVLQDHTSAATFNPAATLSSQPLYMELLGTAIPAAGGATGQMLRKASGADNDTAWQDAPLPVAIFMPGVPVGSAIARVVMTEAGTFPINFAGSYGPARVASSASKVVTIKRNATTIGTATYSTSATPTFATTGGLAQSVAAGDIVEFLFPSTPDSTLADIAVTLRAIRT